MARSRVAVCGELAALMGPEAAALLGGPEYARFDCWSCGRPGRAAEGCSAVGVLYPGEVLRVVLAHAACSPSRVVEEGGAWGPGGRAAEVMAVPAVMGFGARGVAWPVVLAEFGAEVMTAGEGGELASLGTARLMAEGLGLVVSPGEVPARAAGWLLVAGGGRARLSSGAGMVFDVGWAPPGSWAGLAAARGGCVVLAGPVGLWAAGPRGLPARRVRGALRRAARAGVLAGGVAGCVIR